MYLSRIYPARNIPKKDKHIKTIVIDVVERLILNKLNTVFILSDAVITNNAKLTKVRKLTARSQRYFIIVKNLTIEICIHSPYTILLYKKYKKIK